MTWQIGSLAVLLLALGGGMFWYERSRPPSQIVALVAVLAALAVAGRILFAPIPNVVATTDIVLIAGYTLGPAPGFAVGALGGLVSNFWLGQGAWTPWQMVGWGMTGIAGGVLWRVTRGKAGRVRLAIVCGLAGLVFGAWMNLQTMVSYGGEMSLERYLALEVRAIPFDLAHITGNIIFALAAGPAMVAALRRFRERFEWRAVAPALPIAAACVLIGGFALQPARARAASTKPVKDAKSWLSQQVNPNGGFGADPDANPSLDMTTWVMMGLGKTGKDLSAVKSVSGSTPLKYLQNNRGKIGSSAILAKSILAIKAANGNPRNLKGSDLVKRLERKVRKSPTSGGRVNVAAYTIMALRSVEVKRSELIDTERWICRAQNKDGGWGISSGSKSEVDSTGAALQVVGGKNFKGKAIGYLRTEQTNNGGFGNGFGGTNSQSTALAAQGMLGANYAVTSMTNGGNSAIDYLERHQAGKGYINYAGGKSQTSVWVTAQALPSLAQSSYFGGKPRDCNDFVKAEKGDSGSSDNGSGGADPGGSSTGSSGSGTSTYPGTTSVPSPSNPGTGSGSGADNGGGNRSPGGFNGSGGGNGDGSSGGGSTGVSPVPNVVDPVVPVVPDAALLAASAAGSQPSVPLAIAIFLAVSGMLIGGTMWLTRKFSW